MQQMCTNLSWHGNDVVNEEVYKTHPKGFIGLQVHGMDSDRQFTMGWRAIKIRPITDD